MSAANPSASSGSGQYAENENGPKRPSGNRSATSAGGTRPASASAIPRARAPVSASATPASAGATPRAGPPGTAAPTPASATNSPATGPSSAEVAASRQAITVRPRCSASSAPTPTAAPVRNGMRPENSMAPAATANHSAPQ